MPSSPQGGAFIRTVVETLDSGVLKRVSKFPAGQTGLGRLGDNAGDALGHGKVEEVRGDGVVGEQPRLAPGQRFQYTSGCVLETPIGTMHGSYQMLRDDGTWFDAEIGAFSLAMPQDSDRRAMN